MKRAWKWYNCLSNRIRTSITISAAIVGLISTIMSIVGISLYDWTQSIWIGLALFLGAFLIIGIVIYLIIGQIFRDSISMHIRQTPVSVNCGNIFEFEGFHVIGCDTHFDTRVDDIVVSKRSLHGQLVLEHGKKMKSKNLSKRKLWTLAYQQMIKGNLISPLER